jgi:acrylyl-CoA reductase (NADPH)
MKPREFKAFIVEEEDGNYIRSIKNRLIEDLPSGDLLIRVHFSSLNYKDALSSIGNKGVTRNYPHTPGIDAVGTIVQSNTDKFKENDAVIVTSYDLGMNTDGGFGQYISVPSEWAVKLPNGLSMKESMIMGTAGLTAGISVLKLAEQIKPNDGKIVVSGATGGVGSLSVAILSKLGYSVTAITGKEQEKDFLSNLGADTVILRKDFEKEDTRPMLKAQFAGGIDTVGGSILDNIIKSTSHMGVVTTCGNVASAKLNLTVFPFILRGVSLIGIGTQDYPMSKREIVWKNLANEWKPEKLMDIYTEISMDELNHKIDLMLQGKLKGRTILNLN